MPKVLHGQLELPFAHTVPDPCLDHLHRFVTAEGRVWNRCIYCDTTYDHTIHSTNPACAVTTKEDVSHAE